jgi:hypothetical protein
LLVAPVHVGPAAFAGDHEHAVGGDDLDRGRVDARQLDHDPQLGRVLGADAVGGRAEASAASSEARQVPEIVDELLDLFVQAIDVGATLHEVPGGTVMIPI